MTDFLFYESAGEGENMAMRNFKSGLRVFLEAAEKVKKKPLLIGTILLLYGAVVAFCIIRQWNYLSQEQLNTITSTYMGWRLENLDIFLRQVLCGEFPQVTQLRDHNVPFYLYASYLGAAVGKETAWQVFLFVQMGAAALALMLYPIIIFFLTNSVLTAGVSPFLLCHFIGKILFEMKTDTYWSMVWIIALGLPLLGIYCREKKGALKWVAFGVLCIFMGLANLPRAHSSLSILLLLCILTVVQQLLPKAKRKSVMGQGRVRQCAICFALIAVSLFSYALFTKYVPAAYVAVTHQEGKIESMEPWHTIYIGLGWEENKYGIVYADGYAQSVALSQEPEVEIYSPRYMEILREEYFNLVRKDPTYIFGTYVQKFIVCIKKVNDYVLQGCAPGLAKKWQYVFLALAACALGYCRKHRYIESTAWFMMGAAVFCMLVDLIFPMMAVPEFCYPFGSFAAGSMLLVFVVIALLKALLERGLMRVEYYALKKTDIKDKK